MNLTTIIASVLLTAASVHSLRGEETNTPGLKDVFAKHFKIGAALNPGHFTGSDTAGANLVRKHFNSITPENVLKWERVHPTPDRYTFDLADEFVKFGQSNGMFIVGHTLVWHSQTPKWVFQDTNGHALTREALLARMREHIHTVVGRYKGKIHGWDVVNEPLNEDGTLRQSSWWKIIGPDYVAKAFEFAHEADPGAELYLNDYSLENAPKREGTVRLLNELKRQGVRVSGIGTQNHNRLDWPEPQQLEATIRRFGELGLKVMITELDVDVLPPVLRNHTADVSARTAGGDHANPYTSSFPASAQAALARRYGEIFEVFSRNKEHITRVTFWGVTDRDSWLNNWPVRGRVNHPLLFDRSGNPKPAFEYVVKAARKP